MREHKFEFSCLPIAVTTGANIRIRKVNNKNNKNQNFRKLERLNLKRESLHHKMNEEPSLHHIDIGNSMTKKYSMRKKKTNYLHDDQQALLFIKRLW